MAAAKFYLFLSVNEIHQMNQLKRSIYIVYVHVFGQVCIYFAGNPNDAIGCLITIEQSKRSKAQIEVKVGYRKM